MEWGGDCPCHSVGERRGSGSVKCWMKGRRLPEAYDYAIGQLRGGVTSAEQQWTPQTCWHNCLQSALRATRLFLAEGKIDFDYLNTIPAWICRLDESGIKDLCVNTWHAVARRLQDKVRICFFHLHCVLWPHVNAIQPDGSGIPDLPAWLVRCL